jgi:NTE family protein
LFADQLDADWSQLNSVNRWLHESKIPDPRYRSVDALLVTPMSDLGSGVGEYYDEMPLSLRVLFKTLGLGRTRGEALASFVLFDRVYTRALIAEGYRDATRQRQELTQFLEIR